MYQKPLLRLLPHPFDPGQCRFYLALAAQTAVESDTEPVCLVTDLLQDFQRRGIPVNEKRIRVPHPDHLLQTLGKTDNCKFLSQTEFRQCLESKIKLSLATVYDNELRKVVRIFTQHSRITAVHDFLH